MSQRNNGLYLVNARTEKEAVQFLYDSGWRTITYDGHESFTCPECYKYLKQSEEFNKDFPNLKAEEYV